MIRVAARHPVTSLLACLPPLQLSELVVSVLVTSADSAVPSRETLLSLGGTQQAPERNLSELIVEG